MLRAGSGFTGRANSVLPLGSPGCSFDDAFAVIDDFYRRHDLTPLFQVPVGPETDDLQCDLADRGWVAFNTRWVLVADLDTALAACPPPAGLPPAAFADRPSPEWLAGYVYRGTPLPPSAVAVLENADNVVFCSLVDAERRTGGASPAAWSPTAGSASPRSRSTSPGAAAASGRHLMGELMRWAAARGARRRTCRSPTRTPPPSASTTGSASCGTTPTTIGDPPNLITERAIVEH